MGQKLPLGAWLISQAGRNDQIGELAKAARADPHFPRDGDAMAISRRLNEREADWTMHEALESAKLDWAAF